MKWVDELIKQTINQIQKEPNQVNLKWTVKVIIQL